jgi:hypothetical protein
MRLVTGRSVNGLGCGHSLNRRVGTSRTGTQPSGQFVGRLVRDGLRAESDREASPLFERGIILALVVDAVSGLLHDREIIPRYLVRNSLLRFIQQGLTATLFDINLRDTIRTFSRPVDMWMDYFATRREC